MGANTAVQTNKKTFGQWLRSRKGQQTVIIVAFIIIPLLLLFTFTYLPFAEMVKFSGRPATWRARQLVPAFIF